MVAVAGHRRKVKVYGTPEERRRIHAGLELVRKYGWDEHLPDVCVIKALDTVSHTGGPFVKGGGNCIEIVLEPDDLKDDVETGLAIGHEAEHAHDIVEQGFGAVDEIEDELRAHGKTRDFVVRAMEMEDRPRYLGRLAEELREQDNYIAHYRAELAEGSDG